MKTSQLNLTFSNRELEVLQLIIEENTCDQIASLLHLSIRTVESHRRHIIAKSGCNNMIGAVVFALRNKLVF